MKEQFVHYSIAIKLRNKGFNEPCFAVYHRDGSLLYIQHPNTGRQETQNAEPACIRNYKHGDGRYGLVCVWDDDAESIGGLQEVAAPLRQQVIDWFIEKHHLYICLTPENGFAIFRRMPNRGSQWSISSKNYENQHAAMLAAIKKSLTLI